MDKDDAKIRTLLTDINQACKADDHRRCLERFETLMEREDSQIGHNLKDITIRNISAFVTGTALAEVMADAVLQAINLGYELGRAGIEIASLEEKQPKPPRRSTPKKKIQRGVHA